MKALKTTAATAATACLLGGGGVALAASAPSGGPIRVFVSDQTATKDKILITGAIADYGRGISMDANGKTDPNGNFEKVTLKHGGFIIDSTALNKAIEKQFSREPINHTNCSLALTGTGPVTIKTGTGAYAGISGKVKVTLTVAGIAAKTKSGKCNPGGTAEFYGQYTTVTGTGTVSFN